MKKESRARRDENAKIYTDRGSESERKAEMLDQRGGTQKHEAKERSGGRTRAS